LWAIHESTDVSLHRLTTRKLPSLC
jgi:hypothetical protein